MTRRSVNWHELAAAVQSAYDLGAELEPSQSGIPLWLHEAVTAALPEHYGFGYIEGMLIQRGPPNKGGFRFATEAQKQAWAQRGVKEMGKIVPRASFTGLDLMVDKLRRARLWRQVRAAAGVPVKEPYRVETEFADAARRKRLEREAQR